MSGATLDNLLKLVNSPRDGALLRFSIGNEYAKLGDHANAAIQLREALARDPSYSAAWKLLGKVLADSGALQEALAAYREGISAAQRRGDKQAMKEMQVFAKRIEKVLASSDPGTS